MSYDSKLQWQEVPVEEEIIPRQRIDQDDSETSDEATKQTDDNEMPSKDVSSSSSSSTSSSPGDCKSKQPNGGRSFKSSQISSNIARREETRDKTSAKGWKKQPLSILWCLNSFETESPSTQSCSTVFSGRTVIQTSGRSEDVIRPSESASSEPVPGPSGLQNASEPPSSSSEQTSAPKRKKKKRRKNRKRLNSSNRTGRSRKRASERFTDEESVDSSPETYKNTSHTQFILKKDKTKQI